MRIFVSYTLRDGILNPLSLSKLDSLLSELGTPYIDILHNNSSHPQEFVVRMLNESSLFIACVTPLFFQSEWVRLEYAEAHKLGLPIILLDCGGAPRDSDMKELWFGTEGTLVPEHTQIPASIRLPFHQIQA